jgi:hypothetical protein
MSHKKIISQVNVHDESDDESPKMILSANMNMKKKFNMCMSMKCILI